MKKYVFKSLTIALLLVFTLTTTLSSCALAKRSGSKSSSTGKKIVLLVNGNLGDKGFFDSAASGIKKLAAEGYKTKIIEMGTDSTTYNSTYMNVSQQDWDIIVSGTFSVMENVEKIAPQFPQRKYIFYDGSIDFSKGNLNNVMGINYKENEGSFMAGALAASMVKNGTLPRIDASKHIYGFIGSMDEPEINDFMIGYIDGIQYIDKSAKLLTSYVGSFNDVAKCSDLTNQLYNQGAQVVFAPTSQSILGAVTTSSKANKDLIACDADVYSELQNSQASLVKNVVTSAVKNVGNSLDTIINEYEKGSVSFGKNYSLGLDSGSVGLAANANYSAMVPESIRNQMQDIQKQIIVGKLKVRTALGMSSQQINDLRNSLKP